MYLSRNEDAIAMYGGMTGAYLSTEARGMSAMEKEVVLRAMRWLQGNNRLIQLHGFGVTPGEIVEMGDEALNERTNSTLPQARISEHVGVNGNQYEPALPVGHPDIVVNPLEFESEVRNEDYRAHRLPVGVIESQSNRRGRGNQFAVDYRETFTVPHGDPNIEALVFPVLYMNGIGHWRYTRREVICWISWYLIVFRTEWWKIEIKQSRSELDCIPD